MEKKIRVSKSVVGQEESEAVENIVRNIGYLGMGEEVQIFENELELYIGNPDYKAICVNSGTSALHIACLALGLKEGDWLWTSPISFVASSNCALYCGANVDFIDIDSRSFNISVQQLEKKIKRS